MTTCVSPPSSLHCLHLWSMLGSPSHQKVIIQMIDLGGELSHSFEVHNTLAKKSGESIWNKVDIQNPAPIGIVKKKTLQLFQNTYHIKYCWIWSINSMENSSKKKWETSRATMQFLGIAKVSHSWKSKIPFGVKHFKVVLPSGWFIPVVLHPKHVQSINQ